MATRGEYEPGSPFQMNGTDESSSSWMRAHPASSPLGDGAPSSGLSKTERGFALCMFTEKITFNSQPSSRTSILVGRNTCRRRACRTGSPSPSISLTFALAGTLGKPFRKHLVLPPFKLFILNWDLACCHRPASNYALRDSQLKPLLYQHKGMVHSTCF